MRTLALIFTLGLFILPVAQAQTTGSDVIDRTIDAYEEMMAPVDNYLIEQESMGVTTTMYFERQEDGEYLGFYPTGNGLHLDEEADISLSTMSIQMLRAMQPHARAVSDKTINGTRALGVRVEDFRDIADRFGMTPEEDDEDEMTVESATFYVGADDYLVRQVVMDGTMQMDGDPVPVSTTITFDDFRTIDGMRHPFHSRVEITGIDALMSDQDREEIQEMMEGFEQAMEQMPPEQREMMEAQMRNQMAEFEQMMAGDAMTMEMRVTDLQVNTGRPE